MKKTILLSIISFFLFSGRNYSNAQALEKGDFLITGFSSYPNWGKYYLEIKLNSQGAVNQSIGGFSPSGARLEFMLSNEMSFTLDGIFNSWNGEWLENNFYYYDVGIFRTRIQIGLNYHIPDLDSDNLDLYGGIAIGSNSSSVRFNTNDPNGKLENYIQNPFLNFPLSGRVRVGGTYYVSSNIGVNAELATGGPLISLGVVVKL